MGRCRVVTPGTLKVPLSSVHEARLAALKARKAPRKASKAEIIAAEADLEQARADGDWVEVKNELNAGEQRDVFAELVLGGYTPGEKTVLDPKKVGITKLLAYIVRWSLVDSSGEVMEVSEATLRVQDSETLKELIELVDAHEECVEAERAARKKKMVGARASSLTSGSHSAPAGPSSTSAH